MMQDEIDTYEERAAFLEFMDGLPRKEAELIAGRERDARKATDTQR